jgi:hypothetical protein
MGAAAEHRGNALIARQIDALICSTSDHESAARALQVAADCEEFTRLALAFITEPTGLRRGTVERSKTRRGWATRNAKLVAAHCAWVDADHTSMAGVVAGIERAKAAHALLTFALGGWTVPSRIDVPRAAISAT